MEEEDTEEEEEGGGEEESKDERKKGGNDARRSVEVYSHSRTWPRGRPPPLLIHARLIQYTAAYTHAHTYTYSLQLEDTTKGPFG